MTLRLEMAIVFTEHARNLELPDLLTLADEMRALQQSPAWQHVVAALRHRHDKLTDQLLNPTAKADDVDRIRGELLGLRAAWDAVEQIIKLAVEREQEAKRRVAQETAHV